jgi:hypothetical protein
MNVEHQRNRTNRFMTIAERGLARMNDDAASHDDAAKSSFAATSGIKRTCAVIEAYNRHDEVYLTTVYLLKRLGYEVRVFNTWRNRLKNSFVHAPSARPRVDSALRANDVLSLAEKSTFDLVVFNTLEGADVVDCARRMSARSAVLGFIHNGSFVSTKPEYRDFLKSPRCNLMVLAPYIAQQIATATGIGFMYPVFFNDREVSKIASRPGRRRFCVQGYFDPTRRHYDTLLDAMRTLHSEGREDFEVWVMGRSFAKEFRLFNRAVQQLGLTDFVRYSWKGVGYKSYYRLLNSADFVLPLISPDTHPSYFLSKSTSSIAAAVGFGKIPLVHRRLADLYGISDVCLTYDSDMVSVMRDALTADEQTLDGLRAGIWKTRQRFLEQSQQQLAAAIQEVSGYA